MADDLVVNLDKVLGQFQSLKGINVNSACLKGAYVIEREAKKNAPVDTGFLRSSINAQEIEEGSEVEVGAEYAAYQEFGTAKFAGHPYLRPAIDENQEKIESAVASEIRKQLKELLGR